MATKDDFTKWQKEDASTDAAGQPRPVDLKWRASARSLRRERYNDSQLEAQRDGVIFRWVLAIGGLLALLAAILYVNVR